MNVNVLNEAHRAWPRPIDLPTTLTMLHKEVSWHAEVCYTLLIKEALLPPERGRMVYNVDKTARRSCCPEELSWYIDVEQRGQPGP